jgi:CDP-diacylglycerol--glycerol-3-phosphate 3-phosphatidyltransferase
VTEQPGTGAEPLRPTVGRVSLWNIANAVTVVRLLLVPCFAALLFLPGERWRYASLAVFVLASLTDRLDGELARRYGLITDFGKIADPIADKALIGAALVGLSALGELPWWVTVLIMGREIGVTLLRFAVLRHGVIPASWGGKVKTVLQVVAIALYLLPGVPDPVRWLTMGAAVLVTTLTGGDYVIRALRLRQVAKRARARDAEPAAERPRRAAPETVREAGGDAAGPPAPKTGDDRGAQGNAGGDGGVFG